MVERRTRNTKAIGSIPVTGSDIFTMWHGFRLSRNEILLGTFIPSIIVSLLMMFFTPYSLFVRTGYAIATFIICFSIMWGLIKIATMYASNVEVNFEENKIRLNETEVGLDTIVTIDTTISWKNGRPTVSYVFTDVNGKKGKLFTAVSQEQKQKIVNMIHRMVSVPATGYGSFNLHDAPRKQTVSRDVAIEMVNEINVFEKKPRVSPE